MSNRNRCTCQWTDLFFLSILPPSFNHAVCITSIYLIRIASDTIVVLRLCCVETEQETVGLICNTWKKLGSAVCKSPPVKDLEETHAAAGDWEVGFGVSGALDSTRIFLWKDNQIELLLCVGYISCEKRLFSGDLISVSAVPVPYWFQWIRYNMRGLGSHWWTSNNLRENTGTSSCWLRTRVYAHTKFNVVTSFGAVNVKRDHWQFKVIGMPRNKNKFGAWHAVGKE